MGVFTGAYPYFSAQNQFGQQQATNQLNRRNSTNMHPICSGFRNIAYPMHQEPQEPIDGGELKAEPIEVLAAPAPEPGE